MLVNWKVAKCSQPPADKQPPDFTVEGAPYWFYRYFKDEVQVDVLDISSLPAIEKFEQNKLRFYVVQAVKAIRRMKRYDLVVSHGMQSGVVVSLWRRMFPGKVKHIVFDIGSFNSAAESGGALRLMQFASHSIDGLIYHTGMQKVYYEKCFPWVVSKSRFIRFGTDSLFFRTEETDTDGHRENAEPPFILCTGYHKRDWDTLCRAYAMLAERMGASDQGQKVPILKLIGKAAYTPPGDVKLPHGAKLEMVPYIPVKKLMEQIGQAFFCVLPLENFNYSFGQMTLLQQMALGKAVICARVPSMLDYVQDGKNALFYEAKNAADLCSRMEALAGDEALRCQLGRQAAKYVRCEHNEKEMAAQIEEFFQEVLADHFS